MFIRKMRVSNFKSILYTDEILFDRNIVVLAGRNNTGKTALIESIYRCFQGHYMPPGTSGGSGNPEGIKQSSDVSLWLLVELTEVEKQHIYTGLSTDNWGRYLSISIRSSNGQSRVDHMATYDSPGEQPNLFYQVDIQSNQVRTYGKVFTGIADLPNLNVNPFFTKLAELFIYVGGNRQVAGTQNIMSQVKLDTAASNLHNVLHTLHNNREDAFQAIQSAFIDIFSDVRRLHTTVINQATNIHVEFEHSRDPIPLQECGTGLTHVLIMLGVIFSETNRIVLFDEPHSFLHPSAEKALYDLAVKNQNHQFIITTHSPILLNYPIEKELYLVTKNDGHSMFHKLNNKEDALSEIGISNSDFALSDRVLFVEGPTEEHVLPLLFAKYAVVPLGTTCKIVKLDGTGREFSRKTTMNKHAQLLQKLFSGVSDIKIPYLILLDRDERSEEKMMELRAAYGERIVILQRRELENYMLVPKAIAQVLIDYEKETDVMQIQTQIDLHLQETTDTSLFPRGCRDPLLDVKGSAVLEKIFEGYELEYSKVKHGVAICREILEEEESELKEVITLLGTFFTAPN